jgi:hypothetical protein
MVNQTLRPMPRSAAQRPTPPLTLPLKVNAGSRSLLRCTVSIKPLARLRIRRERQASSGDPPQLPRCLPTSLEDHALEKSAAQKEALRLWRALPLMSRQNHRQAVAFAASIAPTLVFETLGDHDKVVEGWLVRDLLQTEAAVKTLDKQTEKPRNDRKVKEILSHK